MPAPVLDAPVVSIREPRSGGAGFPFRRVWASRRMLGVLVWRELKVRYKRMVIGAAWAVVQPLAAMVVFTVIFGFLVKVPSDGLPYPLFAFAALLPWTFFSQSLAAASASVERHRNLITKVAFPRVLMPLAGVLGAVPDLAISSLVLVGMMVAYGAAPGAAVLLLPVFVALALVTALGVSLWLAALSVEYRDVRMTIGYLQQLWLYATPVVYPSSLIENPGLKLLYGLNPMVSVVEGFRWALLDAPAPDPLLMGLSSAVALAVFVRGARTFGRVERTLADRL